MSITAGRNTGREKSVRRSYQTQFAPDSIVAGVVGLGLVVVGLIAVLRAGLSSPIDEPIVQILGFNHTALLGLIEIGIGLLLLASAAMSSRSGEIFYGVVLGIAGFVGAVQSDSFRESLALEPAMGWIAGALGLLIVATALLVPRFGKRSTTLSHS